MRVLIACEFSGIVRDAFRCHGHDAWSCDLLPCEADPRFHLQMDCEQAIDENEWDLMIAHPPCTYLCNSGVRWLIDNGARAELMVKAGQFFERLLHAPVERIAAENPIPHHWAIGVIGRKYDQIIQPWWFGTPETKATCIWKKNLPDLVPTNIVSGRIPRVHHASPGPNRWKERSRTDPNIAEAMAVQWGSFIERND